MDALLGGVPPPPPSRVVAKLLAGEVEVDAPEAVANVDKFTVNPLRGLPLGVGDVAVRSSFTDTPAVAERPTSPLPRLLAATTESYRPLVVLLVSARLKLASNLA